MRPIWLFIAAILSVNFASTGFAHAYDSSAPLVQMKNPAPEKIAPSSMAQRYTGRVGVIVATEGSVTKSNAAIGSPPTPATAESDINVDDVIETGPRSRALILLSDQSRIILSENSGAHVMDYAYGVPGLRDHAYISVTDGAFMYTAGKLGKMLKADVRFLAPSATMVLNDSSAWAGMFEGRYTVFIDSGMATVETPRGRIRVQSGEGTSIPGNDTIPVRPGKWPNAQVDEIRKTVQFSDVDGIGKRLASMRDRFAPSPASAPQPETIHPELPSKDASRREIIQNRNNIRQQRHEIVPPDAQAMNSEETPPPKVAPQLAPKDTPPPVERTSSGIRLNALANGTALSAPSAVQHEFPARDRPVATGGDPALSSDPARQQEELERQTLPSPMPEKDKAL